LYQRELASGKVKASGGKSVEKKRKEVEEPLEELADFVIPVYMCIYRCICTFIGKRWVWNGGFPHLVLKAEIMGGVMKFKGGIPDLFPKYLGG